MNKFDIRIIFLFFFTLDVLSKNIGQPGELFPIKVNKGIFTSSNGLIKIDNSYYKLVPLSFSKQGQYVMFEDTKISVSYTHLTLPTILRV